MKKINNSANQFRIVADDIQQRGAAVAHHQHVIMGNTIGELPRRMEARVLKRLGDVDRSSDGGETMIGNDQDVRFIPQTALVQFGQDPSEITV